MRALLLAAFLLPAPAHALDAQASRLAFIRHQQGSPLLEEQELPAELRHAFEPVRSVQTGCPAPCTDPIERELFKTKLTMASEGLRLDAAQTRAALANYMPGGVPRLRSAMMRADSLALERVAAARMPPSLQGQLSARISRIAAQLGTLQEAGSLGLGNSGNGAGVTTPGVIPAGWPSGRAPTAAELLAFANTPQAQYRRDLNGLPGDVASPARRTTPRISEVMYDEFRGHFDNEDMRRGLRCVLDNAERMVRTGRFDGGSGPFGAMFGMTNERGRVILAGKDFMMDYREGYGGGTPGSSQFNQKCGTNLSAAQVADLDHFFFAAHTGTIPVVGTAMCAGGSLFWDGIMPAVASIGRGWSNSMRYNGNQLVTDVKGCAAGTRIASSAISL